MKSVRTSLAVIVGAARVSGPGYDGPIGIKLIDGPLPDPLWQEFRAGLAELEAAQFAAREGDEAQPQFEVLSLVTSAGATGAEAEIGEGEQVVDQPVPKPVEPQQAAEGETQAAASVQAEAQPQPQAEPQAEAQPQPQAVDTAAGQSAGTVEPVAGPDNWTWRVQAGADPLARGPYTVYRYITRKADGLRSMFCLMVKDHGQVVVGSEYEGDFEPHYYLGELPADLNNEFEQNRIDKFNLVPTTQPPPARQLVLKLRWLRLILSQRLKGSLYRSLRLRWRQRFFQSWRAYCSGATTSGGPCWAIWPVGAYGGRADCTTATATGPARASSRNWGVANWEDWSLQLAVQGGGQGEEDR
jgi:hypothetical protein